LREKAPQIRKQQEEEEKGVSISCEISFFVLCVLLVVDLVPCVRFPF